MWQKPESGSYLDLKARLLKKMRTDRQVNEKILHILVDAFEGTLNAENIVLSRPERVRLFEQIKTQLLTDLLSDDK